MSRSSSNTARRFSGEKLRDDAGQFTYDAYGRVQRAEVPQMQVIESGSRATTYRRVAGQWEREGVSAKTTSWTGGDNGGTAGRRGGRAFREGYPHAQVTG